MPKTVQVLISFEVSDEATDDDLDSLLADAYAQFDDPRDTEGDRVAFWTRMIGAEWEYADEGQPVVDAMREAGLTVSWDYPGLAVITYHQHDGAERQVSTGLNGWEYGTVTEGGEPTDEPAEPAGLTESVTDPTTIASAWAAWVQAQREE